MEEEWMNIRSFEGRYQISTHGRVKSLPRFRKGKGNFNVRVFEKILSLRTDQDGYLDVCLSKNKKTKYLRVHRLVAEAFIENRENHPFVCHRDDNRKNNNVANLFWATHNINMKDMVSKKRQAFGEKHGMTKLLNKEVLEIRKLYKSKRKTQQQIAAMYKVTQAQISNIIMNKQRN